MLGKEIAESSSATEIELIQSCSVIGKTVDNLKLDIVIQPKYFPVVGEFLVCCFRNNLPFQLRLHRLACSPYLVQNFLALCVPNVPGRSCVP